MCLCVYAFDHKCVHLIRSTTEGHCGLRKGAVLLRVCVCVCVCMCEYEAALCATPCHALAL